MTNNDDIDEAEKLLEGATKAPWAKRGRSWIEGGENGWDTVIEPADVDCGSYCQGGSSMVEWGEGDRDLIVHLRNHAPGWLKELRALRKLRDAAEPLVAVARDYMCDSHSVYLDNYEEALRESQQHGGNDG